MSRLLKQAEQDKDRKRLKKAGDADRDPADLDVGGAPAWEAAGDSASGNASGSDGGNAGGSAGGNAGGSAGGNAGGIAADSAPVPEAGGRIRASRRVGRPRGPDRVKLSVRITRDLDDQLSRAVDQTSMSPQYIVEEALAKHFRSLGLKPKG